MYLPSRGLFGAAGRGAARLAGRFGKTQDGVTAIEFAVVAAPFFALMFAILETALIFFAQQTMETAVANAAREIRTGQAQQQGYTQSQFKGRICDQLAVLFNCAGGLVFDVRTYVTFDSIDLSTPPLDANGNLDPTAVLYNPGSGTDIVVVRAFYAWPTILNFLGFNLSNMAGGKHLLASAAAFRNEPFPW